MTQDLDALPLPDIDIEGLAFNSIGRDIILEKVHAHIRAARREGYALAMRKAQEGREGREPVGYLCGPLEWNPRQSETVVKITRRQQSEYGFTHPIYDSPPPKSDEARDALKALISAVDAEIADEWECTSYHPSLRPALEHARAALAAQQKGGA